MRTAGTVRCRIQRTLAESFFDCGWGKSGVCELKKQKILGAKFYAIMYRKFDTARRRFEGQWPGRNFARTATRTTTSTSAICTGTRARGTGTTTGSTTTSTFRTLRRFPQLSSFLLCPTRGFGGVLLLELTAPTAEHLADLVYLYGKSDVSFVSQGFRLPQEHEQDFQRIHLLYREAH